MARFSTLSLLIISQDCLLKCGLNRCLIGVICRYLCPNFWNSKNDMYLMYINISKLFLVEFIVCLFSPDIFLLSILFSVQMLLNYLLFSYQFLCKLTHVFFPFFFTCSLPLYIWHVISYFLVCNMVQSYCIWNCCNSLLRAWNLTT